MWTSSATWGNTVGRHGVETEGIWKKNNTRTILRKTNGSRKKTNRVIVHAWLLRWCGHSPTAAVERVSNLNGALSDRKEWCSIWLPTVLELIVGFGIWTILWLRCPTMLFSSRATTASRKTTTKEDDEGIWIEYCTLFILVFSCVILGCTMLNF